MNKTSDEPATGGESAASNSPTHYAYQVRDIRGSEKSVWTRVGSVWPHADGKGFNIQLDAVPLDGRLSLRTVSEKQD